MIHPDIHPDQHFRSQATVMKCTSKGSWDTLIAITGLQKLVFPVDSFFFFNLKATQNVFLQNYIAYGTNTNITIYVNIIR